jgi:hypothetical protein
VQQELAEVSRAVILSNLTELVDGLEIIKNDLQEIHLTTESLQSSSNNLARSKSREHKSSGTSVMSDTVTVCWHREKIIISFPFPSPIFISFLLFSYIASPSLVHHIPIPFLPSSPSY